MDPIGTTSAIIGLVSTVTTLIRQVDEARDGVKERPKRARYVSAKLRALDESLAFLRHEPALQTAAVERQVKVVEDIVEELQAYYEDLRKEQEKKRTIHIFCGIFVFGNTRYKELGEILTRLDRERGELMLSISVTHVGMTGNLRDGFHVALDTLTHMSNKVKEISGRDLVLAERLKGKPQLQATQDGIISLDDSDIESLGLDNQAIMKDRIPFSQLHIDGETGVIQLGGSAWDANTGINVRHNKGRPQGYYGYEAPNSNLSATIRGKTGNISIGGQGRGINTGVSVA